jgi:GNAT superfamily N-acetyltransferase
VIRNLEEASLAGLPAITTEFYDGWLIRQSRGYTRRANSVWPLYASRLEIEEKIAYCETRYSHVGLPCAFKLTGSSEPWGLDGILEERGYQRDAETVVAIADVPSGLEGPHLVDLSSIADGAWLDAWQALSDRATQVDVLELLLHAVPTEATYAVFKQDGRVVGCGRAAISGNWVGLFDLLVAPDARRRGVGAALIQARLAWGLRRSARRAFLQVMAGNATARRLQEAAGFREEYRYWYRVRRA